MWHTRTVPRAAAWLLLLALPACSWIPEYAWNRFGTALEARTDEWLALEADGEAALRARMTPWLAEMRHERLPRYAALLRTLAARTRDGGFDDADAAPGARQASDGLRAGLRALLVELHDMLTPTQRRGTIRRLRGVADDLETVAAAAPGRAAD